MSCHQALTSLFFYLFIWRRGWNSHLQGHLYSALSSGPTESKELISGQLPDHFKHLQTSRSGVLVSTELRHSTFLKNYRASTRESLPLLCAPMGIKRLSRTLSTTCELMNTCYDFLISTSMTKLKSFTQLHFLMRYCYKSIPSKALELTTDNYIVNHNSFFDLHDLQFFAQALVS